MNQYKTFWNWLESHSSKIESLIHSGQSKSVEELISKELDRINPDISWEISTNKNNEVSLSLSAQGDKALGKLLDEMFIDRPSIPTWKIDRYKQPKSLSVLSELINSQGYNLKLENVNVQVALNPSNTKVDVELISPDFAQVPSDRLYDLAFFILDGVLGEKMVEERIGKIKVNTSGSTSNGLSLSDLSKFMQELLRES